MRSQIAIATVDNPKGTINGTKQSFTIFDNDQLTEAKPWNDVIIAYRNGAPVRVRDIGVAVAGPVDTLQAAWSNGKRSVFLVVFKQPGVNVIKTVESIKKVLVRLEASIPPDIHVAVTSDRTTTIRASVEDVQFTLMLTIGLVVMVIFVFLRSVWATIIPSVTVPLALLGACALMWSVGYSLDNLSLMALTIAVGFVVDDAIVMLENITRHVEEGAKPFAAALKGASEIGFTIVSISVSLIAVLIPLLLMSGHHRPPVPRIRGDAGDDDRRFRDRLADADADDGLALSQGATTRRSMGAFTSSAREASSRWREAMSAASISCCGTGS